MGRKKRRELVRSFCISISSSMTYRSITQDDSRQHMGMLVT